jgi:hypothetical protein
MQKSIIRLVVITLCLLIIPMLGNRFVDGWNWTLFDFVWAGTLIFLTGLTYIFISKKANSSLYKKALALSIGAGFILIWINAAVGIIGEDNGSNLLYFGALLIGFISAALMKFESKGMSRALFITALLVFLIPFIALLIGIKDFSPSLLKVFALNTFFALVFLGSGLLFKQTSHEQIS